ncbi:hypothetical protein BH23GEM9_BH23GEM9_07070 [soil metagenome]
MLAAKIAVAALCLVPAALLVWRGATGRLTANPIEFITLETGFWALTLLMVTLAVTPLRRITGWNRVIAFRRMIGLFAFFYATLHLLTYVTLDRFFDFTEVGADILKRPYITVGFMAFLLLVPLAITSTRGWIRRLGPRWQKLHRLVYLSAALAVLHFYWKKASKADIAEPILFAGILAGLLLFRIGWYLRRRRRPGRRSVPPPATAPHPR